MAEIAVQPGRPSPGRTAQRRRTRRAIVEATSRLLAAGGDWTSCSSTPPSGP